MGVIRKKRYEVFDTPTKAVGKKRVLDDVAMCDLLRDVIRDSAEDSLVLLERAQPMPTDGKVSLGHYMYGAGLWHGLCVGMGCELKTVAPQTWKKYFQLTKQPKQKSIELARKMFPKLTDQLARVKDHNRAEALLLALYLAESVSTGMGCCEAS